MQVFPCTGSTRNAANRLVESAASSAERSLKGMISAGPSSPKPARSSAFPFAASAPSVMPWKPRSHPSTALRPVKRRASFSAHSTASVPEFVKNANGRSAGMRAESRFARRAARPLASKRTHPG